MVEQVTVETLHELSNQNGLLREANVDVEAAQVACTAQEQVSHEWDTQSP